jgi:death-on-curing protein
VTDYLRTAEVEAIHADQIARYGGTQGLRDAAQLDAAVHRPQSGYYADRVAEAAALWESLSQNHPFVDGNKRTALAPTYTFLAVNGVQMTADADTLWAFLDTHYSAGTLHFDVLDAWLRDWTERDG